MIKKKTPKKRVKKAIKKQKVIQGSKTVINFLKVSKSPEEYFRDIVKKKTYTLFNDRTEKFYVFGKKELAKEFKISVSVLNRLLKKGFTEEDNKKFNRKINSQIKQLKKQYEISDTVNKTKMFNRDSFTFDEFEKFFTKHRKTAIKNERLFYRSCIYVKMNSGYTISEFFHSHYSTNFKTGTKEFFQEIKYTVNNWQSMLYFYFIFLVCERHKIKEL